MPPSDSSHLEYRVFTVKRPGLSRDLPPGHEALMWVANSATLIYGERDAVLVDTFLTNDQNAWLVDQVVATGKNLTHVYITHGHGDHFFGVDALKKRFPGARAMTTVAVVEPSRDTRSRRTTTIRGTLRRRGSTCVTSYASIRRPTRRARSSTR